MKNAVLFNYYIGDSTFGGVIAYIDDRETAKSSPLTSRWA